MLFECVGRRAIEVSDGLTGTGMFSCASVGRIPYLCVGQSLGASLCLGRFGARGIRGL